MDMVAILVMWPTSFEQILSTYHKGSTWNMTLLCPAAWEMFEGIRLSGLVQRSNNDLDLRNSYVFMYTQSQLIAPTFSS